MSPVQAVGRFYDGVSGKSHEVMIGLSGSGLRISATDGSFEKSWSYNELQVLEDANAPQPAKLTSKKELDARLFINPDNGWIRIKDKLPRTAFPTFKLSDNVVSLISYLGFSIAFVLGLFYLAPKMLEETGHWVPYSFEQKLGAYVLDAVIEDPVCVVSAGQEVLDKIVRRLEKVTGRGVEYQVQVVHDDEMLNALAAPGARLVLFSGVIERAETAEEIAGVLAHEMAHIELYHPTRGLMRDMGLSVMLSMMFGSADVAQFAGSMAGLKYSREDEKAADDKGQEILVASHIRPEAMALFFERILEQEQEESGSASAKLSGALTYFSTHPQTESRIEDIRSNAYDFEPRPILSPAEFRALKDICSETEDFQR